MSEQSMPLPRLLDGEELLYVKEFDEAPPADAPSSLRELELLAGAKNAKELGDFGPVLASLSLQSRPEAPEFRRYEAIFGRDSLRVALDLLDYYPKLAQATLLNLAASQGVEINNVREEEPGRIIHEDRDPKHDPVARELSEQRGWAWPYYGSVDATPEFVRTIAAYCRRTPDGIDFLQQLYIGRDGRRHAMVDSMTAAIGWIVKRLDSNPEGLLESKRTNPGGIENQVWKDSWDAYSHADGTLANRKRGVASVEAQRVVMDALLDAAELYELSLGRIKEAKELRARADQLRAAIFKHFWTDERGGYFILGTDRGDQEQLRPLKLKTSNMGQLLHSRLLEGDGIVIRHKRETVITQLFSPELLSPNGIRTLATSEVRFRPGSYHNGSVWIWDNYLIAQGLEQHGYHGLARYIENLLLDNIKSTHRLVEFLRGDTDTKHRINNRAIDIYDHVNERLNRLEQPPQDIQAWSAAAILAITLRRAKAPTAATDPAKRVFEDKILRAVVS